MKTRIVMAAFCIVGIALSAVSIRNHYSDTPTEYCDLSQVFNCDIVNRSVYSEFLGIPVATLGTAGYALLLLLSFTRRRILQAIRLGAAVLGVGFSVYLTYIEAYVLAVWCVLCIASLVAIVGIAILSAVELVARAERSAN